MMPNVVPRLPGWRRHLPVALYLVAMAALVVGMARPQASIEVPRERATVMLVIDTSNSMTATDVEPTRLDAARAAAQSFVDQVPQQFQIGVVGFASRARVLAPPTTDRVAVTRALQSLETSVGTAIGDGLVKGLRLRDDAGTSAAGDRPPMVMLLLSDGNNTTGKVDPAAAAEQAQQARVRVYTIALGNRRVSSAPAERGRRVRPLNFAELESIAETTGGEFFAALTSERLQSIYRDLGSSISTVREDREITVAFVGAGLVALLAGSALSSLWFNRMP
jgi:Ca-activated chloride channel family protein